MNSIILSNVNVFVTMTLFCIYNNLQIADAIRCYECDSFEDFTCTENWDPDIDVNLSFLNNCSHVSGASYCIKMTGIYQVGDVIHRNGDIIIHNSYLDNFIVTVRQIILGTSWCKAFLFV